MPPPLRFSALSPARKALVRLCQTINFGNIEAILIRGGEPVFDPPPTMVKDIKLDSDEGDRPELGLPDFVLGDEVLRLIARLDALVTGTIRRVEVRAGVPRRVLLESPAPPWPDALTSPIGGRGEH